MARAVVGVEFVRLVQPGQLGVQRGDRGGRREPVVDSEQAQQRAAQVRRQVQDRFHGLGHALRRILNDEGAVAVHRGVERQRARRQVRVPPARAVPDDAELPVGARQPAQVLHRAGDIADQSLVGHPAGRPHRRCGVIGIGARGLA